MIAELAIVARWGGLVALGAREVESGGQFGLEANHVLVEVGIERPVLALLGGLPEAGPAVGVVAAGAGDGQGGVGLALVGDVVRLQLVGGVEVGDGPIREALLAPEVLGQLEMGGRFEIGRVSGPGTGRSPRRARARSGCRRRSPPSP